jgi:hypothetical protein
MRTSPLPQIGLAIYPGEKYFSSAMGKRGEKYLYAQEKWKKMRS